MAVEAPQGYSPEDLKLRKLVAKHKLLALCAAATAALVLAMLLFAIFGSKAGAVGDSTSCSQWGSANQVRQADYARLYVREHGPLSNGASSVAAVEGAINSGCIIAFENDEETTVSVLQSIRKEY
jgi:hypothetical protein